MIIRIFKYVFVAHCRYLGRVANLLQIHNKKQYTSIKNKKAVICCITAF